jgi:hypothetical protein
VGTGRVAVPADPSGSVTNTKVRVEYSRTYAFRDDFFRSRSYERRKRAGPPIRGSSSCPDTEPPSTNSKVLLGGS